jgi:hypothetical protein
MSADETPFQRRFFADRDELVAARWWQDVMSETAAGAFTFPGGTETRSRRQVLAVLGTGAVIVATMEIRQHFDVDRADPAVTTDALDLQRHRGWNVGAPNVRLGYPYSTGSDAVGHSDWRQTLDALPADMAPAQTALLPFYVPTLFQVVTTPDFRGGLVPEQTPDMRTGDARGAALVELFRPNHAGEASKSDTALLIDLPGPEAMAVATALASVFEPVFLFDNWPHPRGVVPSHDVVAAAVYYRPLLLAERATRGPGAPPAFIIDSRRLNPYRDDSDAFDNRYLARLPSAAALQRLGVRHLLYVTQNNVANEADDLNDDFVAFRDGGVDVKMVPLSDFHPAGEPGSAGAYSYGGSPQPRVWFWHSYGWYAPPAPSRHLGAAPTGLSGGETFRPASRPTIFSSRSVGGMPGFGKQKPSGFGRVSYRTSSGGEISIGRSGSLGRTRFWSSGG